MATAGMGTVQQSSDLTDLMHRFYRAARAGDAAALEGLISRQDGVLCIGTDPQEWWVGCETILRVFRAQKEEMGGGLPLVAGQPTGYVAGDVGWAADRPKLTLPDGEMELRLTMTAHKEEEDWKIVQAHFSLGVPNEEAFGQDMTV
jgi:ketosteroid isomerase-like protein